MIVSVELYLCAGCGLPTSVDFISTDSYQMVASYSAAKVIIFDLETGQSVLNLDSSSTYGERTCVMCVCVCVYEPFLCFTCTALA